MRLFQLNPSNRTASCSLQLRQGIVKKTPLDDYSNIRKFGLIAINLREDDD